MILDTKQALSVMLNALDPEKEITEQLNNPTLSTKQHKKLELFLKEELQKAQRAENPLGIDQGSCLTLEDAYLVRQRYISGVCKRLDFTETLYRMAELSLFGIVIVSTVLCIMP